MFPDLIEFVCGRVRFNPTWELERIGPDFPQSPIRHNCSNIWSFTSSGCTIIAVLKVGGWGCIRQWTRNQRTTRTLEMNFFSRATWDPGCDVRQHVVEEFGERTENGQLYVRFQIYELPEAELYVDWILSHELEESMGLAR